MKSLKLLYVTSQHFGGESKMPCKLSVGTHVITELQQAYTAAGEERGTLGMRAGYY